MINPVIGMKGYEPMLLETAGAGNYDGWIAEPKYDGERAIMIVGDTGDYPITHKTAIAKVEIWTRRGNEVSSKFPEVVEAAMAMPAGVYDGELTAPGGFTSILRRNTTDQFKIRLLRRTLPATYNVFDVLRLNGNDLRGTTLAARKRALEGITLPQGIVVVPCEAVGDVHVQLGRHLAMGYEGIVLKRLDSTYAPGKRSRDWLKMKMTDTIDVYVVGATVSHALPFGALVLMKNGKYYGKVGTGFDLPARAAVLKVVQGVAAQSSPVALPADVQREMLLMCAPIPAEIRIQEEQNGSPRFPVWVRWRTEA